MEEGNGWREEREAFARRTKREREMVEDTRMRRHRCERERDEVKVDLRRA